MIYFFNIIVLSVMSLLTLSTFNNLRIFGVAPLLPLFFIINLSYYRKGFEPVLLAALAGIYFDLFSAYPFGLYLFLFLGCSVLVRYMFQEGMRSFSFFYFLLISGLSITIYYLAQIVILYFEKATVNIENAIPVLTGIIVNVLCGILIYTFSGWYFEKLKDLENVLKRR